MPGLGLEGKVRSAQQPMNLRWGNPRFIHRRLVAVGDRIYVTLGYSAQVSVLDAETGKQIRTLDGTENTCEILHHQRLLVLSVATEDKTSIKLAPPLAIVVVDPADPLSAFEWRAGNPEARFKGNNNGTSQGVNMRSN